MRKPTEAQIRAVMSALGKKGGAARAKALSPERRTAIARGAIAARWAKRDAALAALVDFSEDHATASDLFEGVDSSVESEEAVGGQFRVTARTVEE